MKLFKDTKLYTTLDSCGLLDSLGRFTISHSLGVSHEYKYERVFSILGYGSWEHRAEIVHPVLCRNDPLDTCIGTFYSDKLSIGINLPHLELYLSDISDMDEKFLNRSHATSKIHLAMYEKAYREYKDKY